MTKILDLFKKLPMLLDLIEWVLNFIKEIQDSFNKNPIPKI